MSDLASRPRATRGQVLVIFAGALVTLMVLMAIVVDIGWYWSNLLKIQRAADSAALAGAVYLPDNFNGAAPNAQTAALAAAKRNGYVPDADTSLVSTVDANNPRQLDVTITDKVGTFFMKVVGIQTLNASRSSKAEFVLPVPMGSPQNYYGLGTFLNLTGGVTGGSYTNPPAYNAVNPTTGISPGASTTTGSAWLTPNNAFASDGLFATSATNNGQVSFQNWTFGAFQTGAIIDGLVINVQANVDQTGKACLLQTEVSWDSGKTWGNGPQSTVTLTKTLSWYVQGSLTNEALWSPANHTSWVPGDFDFAKFRVRETYLQGNKCGTLFVDEITAVVYSHNTTVTPVETTQTVNGPTGSLLTSQGFWGADITKGGSRENGDEFGPINDNLKGVSNPEFDGKGVDYNVVIAGPNGQVQLFDPTFCETGRNSGGGNYGTGDHWIGGSPNGVTTIYTLSDQNGTPYDISDDTQMATSGNLFAAKIQADYSGNYGTPDHSGLANCAADPYHNAWYTLATGLPAGSYRLNVTTNVSGNNSTNAENMWSAWVSSSTGNSQVYGQGKMVTYNNLLAGKQLFYLAQIDRVHAGKMMEIKLFDPGDVGGDAFLRILSPDGNAYSYVNFTYTADNGRSSNGASVSSIQTAASSSSLYQDALITIEIPLPITYGSAGLTPGGEPGAGWWKIEYTVAGGNDTTTWQVDIQGNPVHLLVP